MKIRRLLLLFVTRRLYREFIHRFICIICCWLRRELLLVLFLSKLLSLLSVLTWGRIYGLPLLEGERGGPMLDRTEHYGTAERLYIWICTSEVLHLTRDEGSDCGNKNSSSDNKSASQDLANFDSNPHGDSGAKHGKRCSNRRHPINIEVNSHVLGNHVPPVNGSDNKVYHESSEQSTDSSKLFGFGHESDAFEEVDLDMGVLSFFLVLLLSFDQS